MPLIEQTALARPTTEWVARTALPKVCAWQARGFNLSVSINASALNLDEADFAVRLLRMAEEEGVDPRHLELEFTESAIARDTARVIAQLGQLRAHGIEIAIDDFGSGYSNLKYIHQLPVSVLQIDQSFVRDLAASPKDQALVCTMISMAHDLGYRVVAEDIETQEAYDLLLGWGCDEGQGYLMSRPVSVETIEGRQHLPRAA